MEEENDGSPVRGEHLPFTLADTQNSDLFSIVDPVDEDFEEQDIEVPVGDEGNDLDDEDRRSSSTPTQDDNVSPIGGIKITSVPPLQARLTDHLLSTLSESHDISGSISFNTLTDNQDYHPSSYNERCQQADPVDLSDEELAEKHLESEERLVAPSISRASGDSGDLANFSPVSNSSLNVNESRRQNEDDISLSDLSDPESGKHSFRKSDLEDGEIMGKNRPASASPVPSPKRNQQRLRRRGSGSSDDSSSRKSDSIEKGSAISDTSKPESPRPNKSARGGSAEFRQTDKRRSRIRRDATSIDPETSPRQNAPSTRSRRRLELPRYDVRNIINNKRDARKKRRNSASQSRSRSRSRSRNRFRRRSRSRSRNRSSSRGRRRSPSKSKSLSRSKSRPRRRSFSREKKRSVRRRSISNERSRNGRWSRSRSYRSHSRSRSRSLSSFSRRRNSSDERRRRKSKRNDKEPKRRLRGRRTRSPSVIIEQVNTRSGRRSASPFPVSSISKRRRKARSPTPPPIRKKTKGSKKLMTKSDKQRKKTVTKKGKTKKSREDVGKGKKKKSRKLNVVGGSLVDDDLSNINTHVSSEVADKEVFTSGDKIMVSVNFRSREPRRVTPSPPRRSRSLKQKLVAVSQKPVCVIDMLSSPYRIIEDSPKEIVEILSDSDEDLNSKKQPSGTNNNNNNLRGKADNKRTSPKGSSEVITISNSPPQALRTPDKSNQQSSQTQQLSQSIQQPQHQSNQQPLPLVLQQSQLALAQFETTIVGGDVFIQTGHKGPCTPPPADATIDLTRGPQTPSDPPDDSYDPCNPTESPVNMWDNQGPSHLNDVNKSTEKNLRIIDYNNSVTTNGNKDTINSILSAAVKALPFLFEDANGTTNGNGTSGLNLKITDDDHDHDNMDLCDDMDIGSPNSPQSSEMSDIFEPPLNTPKKLHLNSQRGKTDTHKSKKGGKLVHMKMVDDKLRIIDDVPSSAVEMAVKEKFLIKVQRQERAVDEIKMVLKPFYNRKKIDKEAYKEILRKCVPKVCHSKKGDINPQKIHKLVTGYVKRYIHLKKKGQQHSF